MNTIQDYFRNAQLALAAYSNFSAGYNDDRVKTALSATDPLGLFSPDFTTTSAQNFVNQFTVINQFTDSGLLGLTDGSGFSATLFQNKQNNQFSLAIRGTEPFSLADLQADNQMAAGMPPAKQVVSLVNYALRLQAGDGVQAQQLTYDEISVPGIAGTALAGQMVPYITNLRLSQTGAYGVGPGVSLDNLTISGHSLGGYLGQVFGNVFGGSASQLYTYNAPGFGSSTGLLDEISGLLGFAPGQFLSGNQAVHLTGIFTDIIPAVGTKQGIALDVFLEGNTHSQVNLTDSLALYNLLAILDPTLNTASAENIGKITSFLKASSNVAANSLEYTLDALRTLLQTDYTTGSANYLSSATAIDNREALYANLQSLQTYLANSSFNLGTPQAPQYGFTLLTLNEAAGTTGLAEAARTDLATRYALYKGNTFVLDATGYDLYTNISSVRLKIEQI